MSEWVRTDSEAFDRDEVLEVITTTTAGVTLVEDRKGTRVWVADELLSEAAQCSAQTWAQTLETPAEYCEEWALRGEDYCGKHCAPEEPQERDDSDVPDYWDVGV